MEIQFTNHAIDRVQGRFAAITSYAEVQRAVTERAQAQVRPGRNILIHVKTLAAPILLQDDASLVDGCIRGQKIYALCTVDGRGLFINTIVLRP